MTWSNLLNMSNKIVRCMFSALGMVVWAMEYNVLQVTV